MSNDPRAAFATPRTKAALSRLARPPNVFDSPAMSPIAPGTVPRGASAPSVYGQEEQAAAAAAQAEGGRVSLSMDRGMQGMMGSSPSLGQLPRPGRPDSSLGVAVEDSAGSPLPADLYNSQIRARAHLDSTADSISMASYGGGGGDMRPLDAGLRSPHTRRITDLDSPEVLIEESVEHDGSVSGRHIHRSYKLEQMRMSLLEEEAADRETCSKLLRLLQDPNGINAFGAFLEGDKQADLVFWKECEDHKKLRGDTALSDSAQEICSRFIVEGCPQPVNLTPAAARNLAFHARNADVGFFSRAQREIVFRLLQQFPLFAKSEHYGQWQDKSAVFDELPKGKQLLMSAPSSPLNPHKHKRRTTKHKAKKFMKQLGGYSSKPKRRAVSSPMLARRRSTTFELSREKNDIAPDDSILVRLFLWDLVTPDPHMEPSLGIHRYNKRSKKEIKSPYAAARHRWAIRRELTWAPSKKTSKLYGKLTDYLEIAESSRSVHAYWLDRRLCLVMYEDGSIVQFATKPYAPDLEAISIEQKYCAKMQDRGYSTIAHGCTLRDYLVVTFLAKPGLALFSLRKDRDRDEEGATKPETKEKSATFIDSVLDAGQRSRPGGHLACNSSHDMVILWWPRPDPNFLAGGNMTLLAYDAAEKRLVPRFNNRPSMEIFDLWWSQRSADQLYVLFAASADLADCDVQLAIYEAWSDVQVSDNQFLKHVKSPSKQQAKYGLGIAETFNIHLASPLAVQAMSPDEAKLLLVTMRGEVTLYFVPAVDEETPHKPITKLTYLRHPAVAVWHPNNSSVLVSSHGGTIQCFDLTLTPIWLTLASESPQPSINVSMLLGDVQGIHLAMWIPEAELPIEGTTATLGRKIKGVDQLLIVPEHGPTVVLQLVLGVKTNTLSTFELINERIRHGQIGNAVGLLQAMDWEFEAQHAFECLVAVFSALMQLPFSQTTNELVRAAFPRFGWRVFEPAAVTGVACIKYHQALRNMFWRYFSSLLRQDQVEFALLLAAELRCREMFLALSLAVKDQRGDSSHLVAAIAKTAYDLCITAKANTSQTSVL